MPFKTSLISSEESIDNTSLLKTSDLDPFEKKALATIKSKKGKKIGDIIKDCYGEVYEPSKKYVICVQGSSSSGKSTLAHNIYKLFNQNNISCVLVELDKYYKSLNDYQLSNVAEGKYDFDNPASLDWNKINLVLKGIHDEDEYLDLYDYSFFTMQSVGPIKTKNTKPSIIIIEGIFAFNTLNEKIFNIEEYDALNSEKKITNEFIENKNNYNDFKILNVKMSMCRGKSLEVRIARDVMSRGKERESAILQFKKYVWPATERWINNEIYNSHFTILHGSFNEKKVRLLVGGLSKFFLNKSIVFNEMFKDGNYIKEAMIECSGECDVEERTEMLLRED